MRMLMHAKFPNEPFNTAVRNGTAGATIERILAEIKPEAVYFTEYDGKRGAILVVDVPDAASVPGLAEPFFLSFNAEVTLHIVMSPRTLRGLASTRSAKSGDERAMPRARPDSMLLAAVALPLVAALLSAQSNGAAPLSIARQGYFFAGGKYSTVGDRQVMSGQLFVEFQIPSRQTHQWPLVMVHGGNQTGTNFTGTPDGREGWAQYFLRQGYAVYVVDQAGRGRAAYEADVYGPANRVGFDNVERRFVAPERFNLWPQARLHTQWPGTGTKGDPSFDQFLASQVPSIQDFTLQQRLNRDGLIALLDRIGPAILLTHSQSGAFGWPVADARPDLVKAVVAIEPNGPPFYDTENLGAPDWFRDAASPTRSWGPTAVPLTYSPPAAAATDLSIARQEKADAPDLVRCWMQRAPARTLPNLAKVPILILAGEASYHAPYDHCTVKYLEQAGVRSTFIKLQDVGIRGNGHMMMLEKNNAEIAAVMSKWLGTTLERAGNRRER